MTTSYDSQNRLVSVYQGLTEVANYTYDSAGRRHSKFLPSSGTTTTYLYDAGSPANVLVEYENGTWVWTFVYGPGVDQPLCMLTNPALAGIEPDGDIYYYHQDALGSVIALSDSTGALVERYSYDVFGKPDQASAVGNPYMFTGRRYDSESGLYYYRARMYHPVLGRFLQTDPIGYEDGINWYAYCGNEPGDLSDPSGFGPTYPFTHQHICQPGKDRPNEKFRPRVPKEVPEQPFAEPIYNDPFFNPPGNPYDPQAGFDPPFDPLNPTNKYPLMRNILKLIGGIGSALLRPVLGIIVRPIDSYPIPRQGEV